VSKLERDAALRAIGDVFINVCQPIGRAVIDTPPALRNAASSIDGDIFMIDSIRQDRIGEISPVRHSESGGGCFFRA